ncbi:MAG: hypothetical protein LBQ03_03250 [Puniceicoccales bacterium]|jgi:hypothetical protein|nr:hypothetical protein [Puniceicoccales bacterium]
MSGMNGITRSPSGPTNVSSISGQNQEAHLVSAIDQERGNEEIRDQSSQSPHVLHANGLENASNGDAVDKICNGIIKAFSSLGRILGSILKGFGIMTSEIIKGAGVGISKVIESISDLIKKLTEKLREIVNYSRSDIIPFAANTAQAIREGAGSVGQVSGAIHGAPITALAGGIVAALPNLTDDHS